MEILKETDLIIENKTFKSAGIYISRSTNITIRNCTFTNCPYGIYAYQSTNIVVENCRCYDILGTYPRRQFVQFNEVQGGEVSNNIVLNNAGATPEDIISMFNSSGTKEKSILIYNNTLTGGGPSTSGGGIMLGDHGGNYIQCYNNKLTNPGQYGIAIAGGSNMKVFGNTVYGERTAVSNVGIYVHNYNPKESMANNAVYKNEIYWINKNNIRNDLWINDPGATYYSNVKLEKRVDDSKEEEASQIVYIGGLKIRLSIEK